MRTTKPYMLGFIGCGHMGMAIARGCAASDYIERFRILVYDHHQENMKTAKEERFGLAASEKEVAEKSHIVVLAMTPAKADAALNAIKDAHPECVLSIVTGLSIAHMQEILGKDTMIIRAMPNTPLQIQSGATALCMSSNCKADEYDFVFQMFEEMGTARTIPEDKMNDIVAVHGSVPAYIYYFVQCILEDAVSRGIDEESARALLVQTVVGSGELLQKDKNKPLSDFIDEVATKGGTTIEAVNAFKEKNLADVIHEANERCIKKAEELSH
ncbi:MAG: pyrroline-5-carboxylate reductase [Solobacterium sp.]|jgi:pyrroline-5-carboxylate reductase|nr:pyrroline-5-carboxylate reductase [Solobacterium sp.]MCH4048092.1 pyrroline-5-carboxylate reductase [Solobacterium sp.]MCH4075054.1 pyrroline-5-carboxylate reductase [Solobacterium sp.]MCI1314409.1 pyrroline-5-carboxylate reductase [Solobacterium sp.]MCI1346606.1 pyrroline-5-carboxylate reductase [Solobacterium sp.]